MKLKILAFLALLPLTILNAQVKNWTLEECVAYAVDNNLTIQQAELDLENAQIDRSDALGAFLPSLNGQVRVNSSTGLSFVSGTNQPTNQNTFSVSGGLASSLTLFDGLANVRRFERAKISALAGQYNLDDLKDDIRLNVANAYLTVLSNKETLKALQAQYAITEQDVKRTKELVESGVVPQGDLLEIEATAISQEQQIVNNEALVLISRINLAQLLQITDYENFDIADEAYQIPPTNILDNSAKQIFEKALTFRNDIKFSESNVELADKDVAIAKAANLPTITGNINYSTQYSDRNEIPNRQGEFVVPRFTDQLWIFDGLSFGATMNVPIFNGWGTRNNISRSKISLKRAELQLAQDKLDLENAINQAYLDVTTFRKSYEAAEKTLEARQLAHDYAKNRFDAGLMNAFDFGQAQARVDDAQANVIRTKYDYIFRLKILEFYFGLPIQLN